jgi:hypothetical protein
MSVETQAVEVFGSGDDSLPCLIRSGTLRRGKGGLDRANRPLELPLTLCDYSNLSSCTKVVPFFQVPKQANPNLCSGPRLLRSADPLDSGAGRPGIGLYVSQMTLIPIRSFVSS